MTIQQALEKAKRLQREREASLVGTRQPLADGADVARADKLAVRRRPSEPVRASKPLSFPQVEVAGGLEGRDSRVLVKHGDVTAHGEAFDAYRILRTTLRREATAKGWNRFAITSAAPGDGKSLTAINLALALARENRENVFLLDLDLRSPSVARYLGVRPFVEVGECLTGQKPIMDAFFSIGVERLAIAAGTQRYENSSEILGGEGLRNVLSYISEQDPAAWVVMDLPPVLATADALTVGPLASALILVASEGLTARGDLARAVEMLGGIEIAGIVLNRSHSAAKGYYGGY